VQLLIKIRPKPALTAHIPDTNGAALCGRLLNFDDWHIEDRMTTGVVICKACRRAQAKAELFKDTAASNGGMG